MKQLLYVLGALAVILGGLAFAKQKGLIGKEDLTKVAVKTADKREIVGIVSASGKIYPEAEIKISPDVPGEIIELYVEEGDSVKKGQLLLKIRPDDFTTAIDRSISGLNNTKANKANAEARLEQSRAQLTNAQAELERSKRLFAEELISEQDLNSAQLAYNSAKADVAAAQQSVRAADYNINSAATEVRSARDNYNKTVVRAPASGIISELNVEKGERVVGTSQMAGTEMLTIANLRDMECRIEVPENDIVRVNIGDSCNIEVDAYYGKIFKGIVTQISNSQANQTLTASTDQVTNFEVTVNIAPESYKDLQDKRFPFRPGMSANVDIVTERVTDELTVPIQSVTARSEEEVFEMKKDTMSAATKKNLSEEADEGLSTDKKEYVFVVNGGKIGLKEVQSGIQDADYITVTGLEPGDTVVSAPYRAITKTLKLGEKVKIVPKDKVYEKKK